MKLVNRLLSKSKQSFILSLETYNRLTTEYRVEAFCILFINAWELLLKAKILKDSGDIKSVFYKKERNKQRKTISLTDCLKKTFDEKSPIKKNIEEIQDLRDSSIHLIVDEIDRIYVGIFQAGVLNFTFCLNEWFNLNLNDQINPAMLSIMFDSSPLDFLKIKKKYGKEILNFIKERQNKIFEESIKLRDKRYNLSFEYKLALVKDAKKADIILAQGDSGDTKGILIEVPKDFTRTHPFRQKDILEKIKNVTKQKVTQYDIQAIAYKENIHNKPEFHYYVPQLTSRLYSQRFLDFITNKIKNSENYLLKTRKNYRDYMSERMKQNKLNKIQRNNKQRVLS